MPFWYRFAKPGVIAAASNLLFPPQLRAGGAHTVYFDLYLNNRVGSPSRRMHRRRMEDQANRIFYRAVASSGCAFPWIALNELFGASTTTPWMPVNAQYRANVLAFVRTLAARGARPFLLVPTPPYGADEALVWWRQISQYAYIIREVYFAAPQINKLGVVLGSRRMRGAFRQGVMDFVDMGIPPSRIGLFLGFQVGRGTGGREGLERIAWFRNTKLQALAARQVASELGIHSIWSWGWAHWGSTQGRSRQGDRRLRLPLDAEPRPLRRPRDGRARVQRRPHRGPDSPRFPRGVVCEIAGVPIGGRELTRLTRLTGDRQAAFTALSARVAAGREGARARPRDPRGRALASSGTASEAAVPRTRARSAERVRA